MNNEFNHEPSIENQTDVPVGQEPDLQIETSAEAPTTEGIPKGVLQDSDGQFHDGRYDYAAHRSMPRGEQSRDSEE